MSKVPIKVLIMAISITVLSAIAGVISRNVDASSRSSDQYIYTESFNYSSMDEAKTNIAKDWDHVVASSWGTKTLLKEENGNKYLSLTRN